MLRRNISDSFVNLGRRTQSLIARQLDFITDLERNETDADALDNLFKLDHLATRARRNAESLVVLAGLVPPRTWTAPIAMSDVVRAALGEVEDYTAGRDQGRGRRHGPRPRRRRPRPPARRAARERPLVLAARPPGRGLRPHDPQRLRARRHRPGHGHGRPRRWPSPTTASAGRESYTVAPSRYLGHYVAGILAQRLGAEVRLDESPTGGIAAKIVVPESRPRPRRSGPEPAAAPPAARRRRGPGRRPVRGAHRPRAVRPLDRARPSPGSRRRSRPGADRPGPDRSGGHAGPGLGSARHRTAGPGRARSRRRARRPAPAADPLPVAPASATAAPVPPSQAPGGWEPGALAAEDWQPGRHRRRRRPTA